MPQMSPLSWAILFSFFTLIYLIYTVMVYFFFLPKKTKKYKYLPNLPKKTKYMPWKW
uniref:ATP synthase F0 subunit 8 n=1 Tax=Pachycephus cruentatus TaxID=1090886 RepID=A0A1W6Q5A5_9HYME|nr:ATP synthase F0 subunit 8 [Pachycephus cruentatus]